MDRFGAGVEGQAAERSKSVPHSSLNPVLLGSAVARRLGHPIPADHALSAF